MGLVAVFLIVMKHTYKDGWCDERAAGFEGHNALRNAHAGNSISCRSCDV